MKPPANTGEHPGAEEVDSPKPEQEAVQEFESTQAELTTNSARTTSSSSPTNGEADSLVQPGQTILDKQLPPELDGCIRKTSEKADQGLYGDVFPGVFEKPDGSRMSVAIKRIRRVGNIDDERFHKRIIRETVIWRAAKHPNILDFIGYKMIDGAPCLVSPWCKHGNLRRYIQTHTEITNAEKLKLLCDAARGLEHLHSLKPVIIHGDIKPENVIIKDNLEAALCDFGISRVVFGEDIVSGLTTTSSKMGGTAGYQARELLEGESPPTTQSDVYAFGGLILAAMSGKDPFWKKHHDAARTTAICLGKIPQPVDHLGLPESDTLWSLLNRCWSADIQARPSMKAVIQELEDRMNSL